MGIDQGIDGIADYYEADVESARDYYPFGMPQPGREYTSNSYRYGFNTQELSSEVAKDHYSAAYWEYDARLGRRWNVDPKPIVGVSDYACFTNNPVIFADPRGDTAALFKPDGTFWKFQDDGKKEWSGVFYRYLKITGTKIKNGVETTYFEYANPLNFKFNDPEIDVLAIRNGINSKGVEGILRVEIMSDALVEKQIRESKVREEKAQKSPLWYAWTKSNKRMDFGAWGISRGDLHKYTFYIREQTSYNVGDLGNYLFGKGPAELGIPLKTALLGAHVNNAGWGRRQETDLYDFGPGTNGSAGFFDSSADQRAISAGYKTSPKYLKSIENELNEIQNGVIYGPKY